MQKKPPLSTAGSHEDGTKIEMCLHSAFTLARNLFFFFFFFRLFIWPQNQNKASPDPFLEHMVRKVYMATISGLHHNYFMGPGAHFSEVTVIYAPVN